jgi:hypothetical protein
VCCLTQQAPTPPGVPPMVTATCAKTCEGGNGGGGGPGGGGFGQPPSQQLCSTDAECLRGHCIERPGGIKVCGRF